MAAGEIVAKELRLPGRRPRYLSPQVHHLELLDLAPASAHHR